MSDSISDTLAERGKRYGEFAGHARICQDLTDIMRATPGWRRLQDDMRESLEMQAHKIARILNGDPTHADSWVDIAGYAKLVADRLTAVAQAPGPVCVDGVAGGKYVYRTETYSDDPSRNVYEWDGKKVSLGEFTRLVQLKNAQDEADNKARAQADFTRIDKLRARK